MHDVGIALDHHQLGHVDRAVGADAAQIVARQVHQHDVLGTLFGVGQQLPLQRDVLGRVRAARACAGDGAERGAVPFQPHMQLRRRADQPQRWAGDQAVEVEEEHVGRGVEAAQRAVDAERLRGGSAREALGQHHLEDVARGDVLLGLPHRGHVRLRRQV